MTRCAGQSAVWSEYRWPDLRVAAARRAICDRIAGWPQPTLL